MRSLLLGSLVLFLSFAQPAAALYEIGDVVSEKCWKDIEEKDFCLSALDGNVKVLIYSTGWCPDCALHFEEVIPRIEEFENKNVKFVSLSASGWLKGSNPDTTFLNEWRSNFNIPFPVCASPKDAGKEFFEQTYIPSTIIIDKEGRLAFKSYEATIDEIFEKIRTLVAR